MRRLLDTNAVLYLLSGRLAEPLPAGEYFISVITEMELLSYPLLDVRHEEQLQSFFGEVVIVGLKSKIKRTAVELRRLHALKLPDAIIAATAMVLDAELLTNDRKLQLIPGLNVRALVLNDDSD